MPVRVVEREAESASTAAVRSESGANACASSADLRRRPRRTPAEWLGGQPDRVAAWAVAIGFLLVLAAIISSH
jgi:hypothetical protein